MLEIEHNPEGGEELLDDNLQHFTDKQLSVAEGKEGDEHDSLQRAKRIRKLTEKGQELHDEQVRRLEHRFSVNYNKWKAIAKEANQALSEQCSNELLQEHISTTVKQ
ncbi:hypothetical protein N1851_030042 [Merluccius polli]|uniref:Uncharacterized protein n=1 Tax=Merluccius polli TaxID=89951 RepID=A0AA47M6B5_MERPO|nr:hypothetical protein N1851_030042 [Merluccius polli]